MDKKWIIAIIIALIALSFTGLWPLITYLIALTGAIYFFYKAIKKAEEKKKK